MLSRTLEVDHQTEMGYELIRKRLSGILKSFITGIENLVDHKVKVIRCDNGTEFKNTEMNQFCKMKGILRQFSVARTPQQNEVVGRRINAIDTDDDITLVNVQDNADNEMFDVDALNGEEVFVAGQNENVVEKVVDAAQVSTAATTVTITTEEITLAQALEALKTSKPKVKGIVFQEPGKSTTTTTISSQQSQDMGKGIMIEEHVKPMKKKDQTSFDEEVTLKLQVEFDEEERLAREKDEANVALTEEWDDIQAKIEADHELLKYCKQRSKKSCVLKKRQNYFNNS
ncbi:ribonuclease H-like domain-containing protein [Tanacetum coccineum]